MDEQIMNTEELTEQQDVTKEETKKPKKLSKKKLIILGSVAIVAVVAVVITLLLIPSHFERVKDEAVEIAGQVSSRGDDNFTIDTYPYENTDMSPAMIKYLAPDAKKNALKAIQYVNEELGFNGALYSQMLETNALMGRQSEENDKYRVSWTYHPNRGLEVTYEKK